MKAIILAAGLALTLPLAAHAQSGGAAAGAATGAVGGAIVGGPVGAAIGGVTGAIVGGALSEADQPRVRDYVVQQHRPSVTYERQVVVGEALPSSVPVYEVPSTVVRTREGTGWHYAVVNNRTVIVDNKSRRIMQVIE